MTDSPKPDLNQKPYVRKPSAMVRYADGPTWWPIDIEAISAHADGRRYVDLDASPITGTIDAMLVDDGENVFAVAATLAAIVVGQGIRFYIPSEVIARQEHAAMERTLTIAQARGTDLKAERDEARKELVETRELLDRRTSTSESAAAIEALIRKVEDDFAPAPERRAATLRGRVEEVCDFLRRLKKERDEVREQVHAIGLAVVEAHRALDEVGAPAPSDQSEIKLADRILAMWARGRPVMNVTNVTSGADEFSHWQRMRADIRRLDEALSKLEERTNFSGFDARVKALEHANRETQAHAVETRAMAEEHRRHVDEEIARTTHGFQERFGRLEEARALHAEKIGTLDRLVGTMLPRRHGAT